MDVTSLIFLDCVCACRNRIPVGISLPTSEPPGDGIVSRQDAPALLQLAA